MHQYSKGCNSSIILFAWIASMILANDNLKTISYLTKYNSVRGQLQTHSGTSRGVCLNCMSSKSQPVKSHFRGQIIPHAGHESKIWLYLRTGCNRILVAVRIVLSFMLRLKLYSNCPYSRWQACRHDPVSVLPAGTSGQHCLALIKLEREQSKLRRPFSAIHFLQCFRMTSKIHLQAPLSIHLLCIL